MADSSSDPKPPARAHRSRVARARAGARVGAAGRHRRYAGRVHRRPAARSRQRGRAVAAAPASGARRGANAIDRSRRRAGIAASLFGPSRVRAARTVPGKADDVLATIDAWMQRQELLIVKRHHADRIVWEPRQRFSRRHQARAQGRRARLRAVAGLRGVGDGRSGRRRARARRARR